MAWLDVVHDEVAVRARVERALQAQIGMFSPLWVAFVAATGTAVAWWWMTRWATPVNLEAVMAQPLKFSVDAEKSPAVLATAPAETIVAPVNGGAETLPDHSQPEMAADDLTRLFGVGPKIAMALEARGVTRFVQLAAWSEAELAAFAYELNLKGRALRADLIGQACKLAAGED